MQERGETGLPNDALGGNGLAVDADVSIALPPVLAANTVLRVSVDVGLSVYPSISITYDEGADFTLTFNGSAESPKFTISGTGAQEVVPD